MNLFIKTTVVTFIFSCISGAENKADAQIRNVIERLGKSEQACLDKGIHMSGCSYRFMHQMDSLLNVEYKAVYAKLSHDQQIALRKEELVWIKQRDIFFKKEDNKRANSNSSEGLQGEDLDMTIYDNKANYIQKRILQIEDKWNK